MPRIKHYICLFSFTLVMIFLLELRTSGELMTVNNETTTPIPQPVFSLAIVPFMPTFPENKHYEICTADTALDKAHPLYQHIVGDQIPELILLNKSTPLEDRYQPEEYLVPHGPLPSTKREILMYSVVHQQLIDLFAQASAEEIEDLTLVSGYRSVEYQKGLFKRNVNRYIDRFSLEEARRLAAQSVAIPGTSEHHTGFAIDFISKTTYSLTASFENTPAGQFVIKNAPDYGFILRYPKGKQDVTKIIYEPWHYRYVGFPHSHYMTEHGLALEEYLELLYNEKELIYDKNGRHYHIYHVDDINSFNAGQLLGLPLDAIDVSRINEHSFILTAEFQ